MVEAVKAHLNGVAKPEDGNRYAQDNLRKWLYGMGPAARAWEEDYVYAEKVGHVEDVARESGLDVLLGQGFSDPRVGTWRRLRGRRAARGR